MIDDKENGLVYRYGRIVYNGTFLYGMSAAFLAVFVASLFGLNRLLLLVAWLGSFVWAMSYKWIQKPSELRAEIEDLLG